MNDIRAVGDDGTFTVGVRSVLQEPVRCAGIEVTKALPMEGMAGIVVKMQVCAGDGSGDFFAHPFRCECIVFAADDEGGASDVFQLTQRIVSDGSGALSLHGMHRLGCGISGSVFKALLHVGPAVIIVEPGLGKDEHLYVMHEVLGTHGGLALHEVLPGVKTEAILSCPGTHEDHTFHLLRMTQGELLGDDAAEGAADDASLGDAELVHETGVVIRHHGRGIGAFGFVGLADAAVVAQDAAEVLGPFRRMSLPDSTRGSDAHDADERFAAAALFIIHLDSVSGDVWHVGWVGCG